MTALIALAFLTGVALGGIAVWRWFAPATDEQLGSQESAAHRHAKTLHSLATGLGEEIDEHGCRLSTVAERLKTTLPDQDALADTELLRTLSDILSANHQTRNRLNNYEQQIQQQLAELDRELAEARLDPLTELCNRQAFEEELARRCAEWRRTQQMFSVVLLDIDDFTQFNAKHGRLAGDCALRSVADAVRNAVREMDLVGRFEGGCLAMLLPATDLEHASRAAERMRRTVEAHACIYQGHELRVTVSGGAAEPTRGENGRSLLKRADAALYAAKESGGNAAYQHDGVTSRRVQPSPAIGELADGESLMERRRVRQNVILGSQGSQAEDSLDDARIDAVTGLPNRRVFANELWRRIDHTRGRQQPLSLLLIGVDHLDTLIAFQGQSAVDRTMRKVAQVLAAVVRDADLVTRYGWEDFAVILSGTDMQEAQLANERVRAALAACTLKLDPGSEITVSSGIAELTPEDDPLSLAKRADAALHFSKAAGGNSTHLCSALGGEIVAAEPLQPPTENSATTSMPVAVSAVGNS